MVANGQTLARAIVENLPFLEYPSPDDATVSGQIDRHLQGRDEDILKRSQAAKRETEIGLVQRGGAFRDMGSKLSQTARTASPNCGRVRAAKCSSASPCPEPRRPTHAAAVPDRPAPIGGVKYRQEGKANPTRVRGRCPSVFSETGHPSRFRGSPHKANERTGSPISRRRNGSRPKRRRPSARAASSSANTPISVSPRSRANWRRRSRSRSTRWRS